MANFIFICGAPRSGTTLLTNLLDGHPDLGVFLGGETHILELWRYHKVNGGLDRFFLRDYLNHLDITLLTKSSSKNQFNNYMQRKYGIPYSLKDVFIDNFKFNTTYINYLKNNGLSLKNIYEAVLISSMESLTNDDKKYFIEKRPLDNEINAYLLQKEIPGSKFIHILRDPRSRYLSAKMRRIKKVKGYNIYGKNLNNKDFATAHSEISMVSFELAKLNKLLLKDDYLIIKYEDLITDPGSEIKKITNFLNINFDVSLLKPTRHGETILAASSIKPERNADIINNKDRLIKYYKETSKLEQKILRLFNWESANYFGYNIEKLDYLKWNDLFPLLKYENPFNYLTNRSRMRKNLLGSSSIIASKHFHQILNNFDKGISTQD